MKEELLRETLQRATGGAPPVGDAFARFQTRQRRSARMRMLAAIGAGVGAMVVLFMLLPGAGNEGNPADIGGTGTVSPEPLGMSLYVDRLAKFELRYPQYWTGEQTEGSIVALFPADDELGKRYRTATFEVPEVETPLRFYMVVKVIDGERARARLADIDAQERTGQVTVERDTTKVDGYSADVRLLTYKTAEPPTGAKVETWCSFCVMHEYLVHWPKDVVLDVRFVGPDAKTFEAHREEIALVLESLQYYGLKQK